ncbi:hypothetical protein [uncultured Methanobrevibacter sp.]|uniref:hypothetical protein n=1 Tax=uncultured Methanobrevibacter sp. TaxID=253161 RepID=UPI0025CF09ED|nr:hypothetical protein [uncultured Methanobrevibacter sp.]
MNIKETIKNIRASCNNYVDPNLFAFIIDDDFHMGTNNILEIEGYGIGNNDTYEERLMKIHEKENIFLPLGMMTFMPIINECDLFCEKDYNLKLTQEEFNENADEEEKLFGILIKKDSDEYIIGKTDVCNCSIDASFEKIEKRESEFYEKIEEIISEKII